MEENENIFEMTALPKMFKDEKNQCLYYYIGMKVRDNTPVDISTVLNSYLEMVNRGSEYSVDAQIKKRSEISTDFAHPVRNKKIIEMMKEEVQEEIQELRKESKKEKMKINYLNY